jgi:hypothetical protein
MKNVFVYILLGALLAGCGSASGPGEGSQANEQSNRALPHFLQLEPTDALPAAILPAENAVTAVPDILGAPISEPGAAPVAVGGDAELDSGCLVGTWAAANLASAMVETLAQEQTNLALEWIRGQVLYEFSPDGGLRITFADLAAAFAGVVEGQAVQVVNSLDGSGTARYAVNAAHKEVALSNFGGDGIQFALEINGQVLMENSLPVWGAFTSGKPMEGSVGAPSVAEEDHGVIEISRAAATCEGNMLTLRAVEPVPGPEVQFERIR